MAFNKDDCKGIYLMYKNSINDSIRSRTELIKILRESGRHANLEIASKYWRADTKEIPFNQFLSICKDNQVITKSELSKYLRKLDTNNQGFLDKAEFLHYLTKMCSEVSKRDLTEIVDRADNNGDDKLQFDEIASLLLSNLEPYRVMARRNLQDSDIGDRSGSMSVDRSTRESMVNSRRSTVGSVRERDEDDDDVMSVASGRNQRDSDATVVIEKMTSARFDYREPKNLKNWKSTELRGCLFLGDSSTENTVHDREIESFIYSLTLNDPSSVIITLAPLVQISRLSTENPPDIGFLLFNPENRFVGLSSPADSAGTVYFHQSSLGPGKYKVLPFSTGAKLKVDPNMDENEWRRVKCIQRNEKGDTTFTPEIRSVLEDVFRICDIDGNGYLSKDEFKWYSTRTSEEEWTDDVWSDINDIFKLQRNEMSFDIFLKMLMDEIKQDNYDTSSLTSTLDIFGFNAKFELKEAFPISIVCYVETTDCLLQCLGIGNEASLIETQLCNYVMEQGEKAVMRNKISDCDLYSYIKNGRAMIAVENLSSPSKMTPLRLQLNMEKTVNATFYQNKKKKSVVLKSGEKKLITHGVAMEPKVSISFHCIMTKI